VSVPLRRVVLVDDHDLFRAGVRSELGPTVEIVGEAASVLEAVPLIKELDPDVVLLDVHLPDGGGHAVIAQVAPERPGVRFLALSVSDAAEDVIDVIRAGARGYVTKTISGAELTEAIHRTADGDAVFSPRLAGFVLDAFRSGDATSPDAELDQLTGREREVLQLIAEGNTNKAIATKLGISVHTVNAHRVSLMSKLDLHDAQGLTRFAIRHGLVDSGQ
jgi:DNA-binding NarL/FixJ family response regulator